MQGKLPASILQRKKIGFDIPAHEWLRGPLRAMMQDVLETGLNAYGDLFNSSAIRGYMSRHLARKENVGYHLWGLMILFMWMQRWNVQAARPAVLAESLQSSR